MDPSVGVAYFYCDGNDMESQSPRYIVGRLLRDLWGHKSINHSSHLERFRYLRQTYFDSVPSQKLLSTLECICGLFNKTFVIVDGLDECKERTELLTLLAQLSGPNLNVLLASRLEADISRAFQGRPAIEMLQEAIQNDIVRHVDWML